MRHCPPEGEGLFLRVAFARHRWELLSLVLLAGSLSASAAASPARAPSPAACVAAAKRVAIPPHTLVVEPRSALAFTLVGTRPVEIVIGETALARWSCHVVLHELGHAFDVTYMTASLRRAFRARVVHDRRPWFSAGVSAPAETFAEVFWLCARAGHGARRSGALRKLSRHELNAGCEIIGRASRRSAKRR